MLKCVRAALLTPRQQEILTQLARGFYYKEIAGALGISPATVLAHLHLTYRKLQVNSRHRAVLKFHELNHQQVWNIHPIKKL